MERRSFLKGVAAVIGGVIGGKNINFSPVEAKTTEFAPRNMYNYSMYGSIMRAYYANNDGVIREQKISDRAASALVI